MPLIWHCLLEVCCVFEENIERKRAKRGLQQSRRPVKVGDVLEVKIVGTGKEGDGFAKVSGFVVFIPNSKEGETHKVRVTKVFSKYAFAEIIE
ncbi:MAG: TRAM domain-containing protein [Euryarchaeota archaeon]|nr:TRAM domain-containing protein [Euryarchaeota archaeon]